jgi:hypothetical protein
MGLEERCELNPVVLYEPVECLELCLGGHRCPDGVESVAVLTAALHVKRVLASLGRSTDPDADSHRAEAVQARARLHGRQRAIFFGQRDHRFARPGTHDAQSFSQVSSRSAAVCGGFIASGRDAGRRPVLLVGHQ